MNLILEKNTSANFSKYTLALDIGGTVTQIGLIGLNKNTNKKYTITYSTEIWTKEVKINKFLPELIEYLNKELGLKISSIALAIAGPVSSDRKKAYINNTKEKINLDSLKKKIQMKDIVLMNDFEALGYYVNLIHAKTSKSKKIIYQGNTNKNKKRSTKKEPILVIGPGTGLGKTILNYDNKLKKYIPLASEGGHEDYPAQSKQEQELLKFITKGKRRLQQEDLVSGKGIRNIYMYLAKKNKKLRETAKHYKEIKKSDYNIFLITKYLHKDALARESFKLFSKFYARVVKNTLTEVLCSGGTYLAGGITSRNPEILRKTFKEELLKLKKEQKFIKENTFYLLTDKHVSLIGATAYQKEVINK